MPDIEKISVSGTTYSIKDTTKVLKAGDTMTGALNNAVAVRSPEIQVSTSSSSYTTGCKLVYANDAVKFVFN